MPRPLPTSYFVRRARWLRRIFARSTRVSAEVMRERGHAPELIAQISDEARALRRDPPAALRPVDFNPLAGVRSPVTRETARGRVYEPDQRIELAEALAMYTRTAAEVCGCLDRYGTIAPGKRADLVVLDGALTSAAALDDLQVRATFIGGRLRYGEPGSAAPVAR